MNPHNPINFLPLIESSNDGIIYIGKELNVVYVNKAFIRLFGYKKSEIIGKHIFSLPHYKDYSSLIREKIKKMPLDKPEKWEMEVLTKNKKKIWISISTSPVKGKKGEILGSFNILSDISEKKKEARSLQQLTSQYKSLFELSPVPLAEEDFSEIKKFIDTFQESKIRDLKNYFNSNPHLIKRMVRLGRVINVNQAMVKLFGKKSKEELIGPLQNILTTEDSLKNFENEIIHFAHGFDEFEKTETRVLNSGKKINISCKSLIVPRFKSRWKRVLMSIIDQTKQDEIEEELNNKNKDLVIFIYKVSHDLKSPLASIIGLVNVARMDIKDPESLKYIQMIGDSAQKLETFLSNLLNNFSLAGRVPKKTPINIRQLISSTIAGIRYNPIFKNVKISLTSNQKKALLSDSKILRHIFQNLIDNAAKYKNAKNISHRVTIKINDSDSHWLSVSINDNGCGMDLETREQVFDPFFRGNGQSNGAGLGLYIVKNSIEKLKGRIEVKSVPGKGSSFIVYLPKQTQKVNPN